MQDRSQPGELPMCYGCPHLLQQLVTYVDHNSAVNHPSQHCASVSLLCRMLSSQAHSSPEWIVCSTRWLPALSLMSEHISKRRLPNMYSNLLPFCFKNILVTRKDWVWLETRHYHLLDMHTRAKHSHTQHSTIIITKSRSGYSKLLCTISKFCNWWKYWNTS